MKSIFEQNGGTYTKIGDYYYPDIAISDTQNYQIGKYGNLRRRFLKEHHNTEYTLMVMNGTLLKHLAETDEICHSQIKTLVSAMAKQEGVNEELKANNQMEWVQKINSIHSRAEEIVLIETVYGGFER